MRDVLAGVDSLVADGLADPDRLGLTGGSYGGYLTNWIVGHDDRFAAAMTCRSVSDMAMLFLTGDISGGDWAVQEFGTTPVGRPGLLPGDLAARRTPPPSGRRCSSSTRSATCGRPIGQAEALFTVLRSHRRPVRLLRVPEETHELTRSGTPFRRVENLEIVRDWFAPLPRRGQARPAAPAQGPRRSLGPRAVRDLASPVSRSRSGSPVTTSVPPSIATPSTASTKASVAVGVGAGSSAVGAVSVGAGVTAGRVGARLDHDRPGHVRVDRADVGERAGGVERDRAVSARGDGSRVEVAVGRGGVPVRVVVLPRDGVADRDGHGAAG